MTLTYQAAINYVNDMETQWYGAPTGIISACPHVEIDEDMIDVHTNSNHWSVWIERYAGQADSIYGEC